MFACDNTIISTLNLDEPMNPIWKSIDKIPSCIDKGFVLNNTIYFTDNSYPVIW